MTLLDKLNPSKNSTSNKKRVGRGSGSGMGKTSSRGSNGQKSRTGYSKKRNFEGGQQPISKRLPKVGFYSRVKKPYVININKFDVIFNLSEITIDEIRKVHKIKSNISKIKIIGSKVKDIVSKIKDENISFSGK